jgi:hypothetical protein
VKWEISRERLLKGFYSEFIKREKKREAFVGESHPSFLVKK